MKVLMLTPYLPYPPSSGGQIRSYNLIKQLSKKHEITLCSLIKSEEDGKYAKYLEPFCKKIYIFNRPEKPWTISNIINTGFSSYPFVVIRNFSKEEKRALPDIIKEGNFDLIHAETFYVSPHIPKTNIPIVLVEQTIEYQVYLHYVRNYRYLLVRPFLYIDVLKIKYWETLFWKKAKRVVAVSDRDASVMKSLVPKLNVTVVPNGVGEDLAEEVSLHFSKTILFMGNYAWLQNGEAAEILAEEIFPEILKKVPDVKLTIAGQNIQKIKHLKRDGILLKDLAVDDIEGVKAAYHENGIMVAPLYGPGGTRLKILGAMASKLPVVTTKIGNEGIDAGEGDSVLIGQTAKELADLSAKLLKDKKLYEKVAVNGRKFVEENYFYEEITEKLDKVYREVKNDKPGD